MPFDAQLLGLLFTPPRSAIAHWATADHDHAQLRAAPPRQTFLRRRFIPAPRWALGTGTDPLYQRMPCRVVYAARPSAGPLRGRLIRTGGRHREAQLLGVPRGDLLMRAQPPGPLQRTTPLTRNRIPALINPQFYRAQFAAQGNGPAPSLLEGEKPRRSCRRVLADAPPVVGVPIRGLPPRPLVRGPPDGETVGIWTMLVSYNDSACIVVLCRSRNRYTPGLRTVSRCTHSPGTAAKSFDTPAGAAY